jgi:hypothetical protein
MTYMRNLILFITLILSCSFALQQDHKTISGKWELTCISNLVTEKHSFRPDNYTSDQLLFEFKDDGREGIISAKTVHNTSGGKYVITDTSKITFWKGVSTLVNESGWGSLFWKQIGSANSFAYSNDSLLIYFNNNKEVLKFIPK